MREEVTSWKDIDPDLQATDLNIHTGWLRKIGGKFKTWRKRFFVLQGKHIYYYTNPDDLRFLGEFSVENVNIEIPDSTDNEFGGDSKGYIFIIKPNSSLESLAANHQTFVLSATTAKERKSWIRAIRKVLYLKQGGALFGSGLEEVFPYTAPEHDYLPRVVFETAAFIREFGMTTEGIFRKCGAQNVIQALAEAYDLATPGPILVPEEHNVHIAAGLLKLYLRELPEPVIPFAFYDRLKATGFKIQIGQDMETVIDAIELLPAANYHLLQFLCRFLSEIASYHETNRMTIENLASIFSPNLLRQADGDLDVEISAAPLINLTCAEFIRCHKQLFRLSITPFSKSRNMLLGSTRQRHQGHSRRRHLTIDGGFPSRATLAQNAPREGTTDFDFPRSAASNISDSSEVIRLENSQPLASVPPDAQHQDSPSHSSGIGRSESSRASRSGLTSFRKSEGVPSPRETSKRRLRKYKSTDQYDLARGNQSFLHGNTYHGSYFSKSVDPEMENFAHNVPPRNTSLAMTLRPEHYQQTPRRPTIPSRDFWYSENVRHIGFDTLPKPLEWSQPQTFPGGIDQTDYASDYSRGVRSNTLQYEPTDVRPQPPPFDLSRPSRHANSFILTNDWFQPAQNNAYNESTLYSNTSDANVSVASSMDEFTYASRLDPEEQARYWRTVALRARAEAAGHRARAQSLANEINRMQCDLSMAELEIGLLRQRIGVDSSSAPSINPHRQQNLKNGWSLYS